MRRVLLAVTGLSPQIVTETVFALAKETDPPFVPDEIHLVTTLEGAERARITLLGEDGALAALATEWEIPAIGTALDESRIHIIENRSGEPLPDILTPEDNACAADAITECIRRLTADPETALHVSLAGGRKTMGFLAGYALSLFGREQDSLSHVLVPPELEQHPQFFYPPRRPKVLYARDTRPVRVDRSVVRLAIIPLVLLRHGLPRGMLEHGHGYAATVAAASATLAPPSMLIDLTTAMVTAGGQQVPMPPVQVAFCAWLANLGQDVSWRDADPALFLDLYGDLVGPMTPALIRALENLREGVTKEWFDERKARHNKLVDAALGLKAAPYRVVAVGRRPQTRYRLALPPEAIELRR